MNYTRDMLFVDVCDFLKEPHTTPSSTAPIAAKIRNKERGCALQLLAMHPWNFASTIERLQISKRADPDAEEPDASLGGRLIAYKQGQVARINWVSSTPEETHRLVERRQWVQRGALIYSDIEPLYMEAVRPEFAEVANCGKWPVPVGKAWASLIGDALAPKVVNSRGHSQDVSSRSEGLIEEAMLFDAGQSPPSPKRTGSWNRGRWGRGGRSPGER